MNHIRCAGLHWHGACPKQQQCANYAKWWLVPGVEFNACSTSPTLKHFIPIGVAIAPAPSKTTQKDLFA